MKQAYADCNASEDFNYIVLIHTTTFLEGCVDSSKLVIC